MNANRLACAIFFVAAIPVMLSAQVRRTPDPVALKYWSAPLYWQPQIAEANAVAAASLPANASPLVFVAMTPCRIVDTRASQGFPPPYGPPSLVAGASRTFTIAPSATCTIPSIAQAFSFNITVVPSTPSGFITAYPAGPPGPVPLAATLVWSQGATTSNAAIVPGGSLGSPVGGGMPGFVDVFASSATDIVIDINGYYASLSDHAGNTAVGTGALANNGAFDNTASGSYALFSNEGSYNTASGNGALFSNTTGNGNTASGAGALGNNTTGSNNIAIGFDAASNVSVGNSNNIHIGSEGASGDNGTIRIGGNTTLGDPANQTSFFASGIRGATTGANDAIPVVIDSHGQLGTVSSSRRFKEDIEDMGDASRALLRLRPVTFRYQKPFNDGSKPVQYGLIAEEVAEVFPDLVARSADGQIETVKYQVLDSLLLNELQREVRQVQQQADTIRLLESRIAALELSSKATTPTSAGQ
jgi:hypothetical protein